MTFRVSGLSPAPFRHLFGLNDEELGTHRARRIVAEAGSGLPDRIELRDAVEGEAVLLVNYEHQPADTPFRASHAIFVLEGSTSPVNFDDELPEALHSRLLSIRAFDAHDMMIDADVTQGDVAVPLIERLFANPDIAYLHAHYARMYVNVRGWQLAMQRRFADHRRWMIRSYALTFAAVTLRIGLPIAPALGFAFVDGYRALSFLSWVINLAVVEIYFGVYEPRRTSRGPLAGSPALA